MSIIIHFLNGNDKSMQSHYFRKEYRNDVVVEINSSFYEVYFYVEGSMQYEMTGDGFFALPGLIVLDEISNEKIYASIAYLAGIGYFSQFVGYQVLPYANRFMKAWYQNEMSAHDPERRSSHILEV